MSHPLLTCAALALAFAVGAPRDAPPAQVDPQQAQHFIGKVTGPEGKPVRGARVFIVPNKNVSLAGLRAGGFVVVNPIKSLGPARAETDANGRFEFDAPDMAYMATDGFPVRRQGLLVAVADGLAPDWMTTWGDNSAYGDHWDPVRAAPMNLQLSNIGTAIHGRFRGPDGKGLAGARVQLVEILVPEDRDLDAHLEHAVAGYGMFSGPDYHRTLYQPELLPGLAIEARTDDEGRFTLAGLGPDWLAVLKVSEPSVVDTYLTVMTRDAADVGTGRYLEGQPSGLIYGAGFVRKLKPGRTVTGRVTDKDTGEPIPGMWVGPTQNYRAGVSGALYPGRSDKDGRFTITGLPPKSDNQDDVLMAVAPPGVPYQLGGEWAGNTDVEIKCTRGIPFRLKVVDETGEPVEAEVTHVDVQPNPHVGAYIPWSKERYYWPNAPAAALGRGVYEGFVSPGPGAILIQTPRSAGYRPACVDPRAHFAPGRTEWKERHDWAYGTLDHLTIEGSSVEQDDYAAIVLVNPAPGSAPLELTATVVKDRPRRVNLVDAEGEPVEIDVYRGNIKRRTDSFLLTDLHPLRTRPLTYLEEERKLIGFLVASGDGDAAYTVKMQPWGSITGRLIDREGKPLGGAIVAVSSDDPAETTRYLGATANDSGQFVVDKLIPGRRYRGKVHYGQDNIRGELFQRFAGVAFEDVTLAPGETRDVGELTTRPPTYEEFPLKYDE